MQIISLKRKKVAISFEIATNVWVRRFELPAS